MPDMRRVKVWDGPTRLFHWLLAALAGFSWLSAEKGWSGWHLYSGCAIGALLIFRIVWGFVGSETARFARFLASPAAAARHLRRLTAREPDETVGHNAAGGWMVLFMLALLAAQVLTGLAAEDGVSFKGPLASLVGEERSAKLTSLHFRLFTVIQIAVVLHVVAILLYRLLKRQDLLGPMLHGHKWLPPGVPAPRMARPLRAGLILAVAAGVMAWVARGP